MSTAILRISDRFPDVSTLGRAFGFELDFRQLDGGDPGIPASALISKNMTLAHMSFKRRYHQLGLPPAGKMTFGIPVTGLQEWFGRKYRSSGILPFSQPGGIDGVSEEGFEAYTISFNEDYLSEVATAFQMPVPSGFHQPVPGFIIDRGESNDLFRNMLNHLIHEPGSNLDSNTEEELVITLLQAAYNGAAVMDRSSSGIRHHAIRAALAYIAEHRDEVITVRDICISCDIALRTLNRAFRERFGVGPKVYMSRQRLSAVRNELLCSSTGPSVSDVANRWGFWHLGQFARDYKRLFGELPSETLKG